MTLAIHDVFGISKQRGIWLRCFLDEEFASLFEQEVLKGHDFSRAEDEDRRNCGFSR
jgi:hypothetical protein